MKIKLIGDSVFDNKNYVGKEKSTIEHLQSLIPHHECELLAVDGSVTRDVIDNQLKELNGTDVAFLSTGGNDALGYSDIIYNGFASDSTLRLHEAQNNFHKRFEFLVKKLKAKRIPFVVFTIYSGNFQEEESYYRPVTADTQKMADVLISIFNDVIYRVCSKYKINVVENRDLFTSPDDYAN